jgi:hypothetical protein
MKSSSSKNPVEKISRISLYSMMENINKSEKLEAKTRTFDDVYTFEIYHKADSKTPIITMSVSAKGYITKESILLSKNNTNAILAINDFESLLGEQKNSCADLSTLIKSAYETYLQNIHIKTPLEKFNYIKELREEKKITPITSSETMPFFNKKPTQRFQLSDLDCCHLFETINIKI